MKIENCKLKIIVFLLLTSYFLLLTSRVYAATPIPKTTDVPLSENLSNELKRFKERVASAAAKLEPVERRGIIGTVTDITNTQITLSDLKQETRYIDVDELTKFSSPASKDFGISDIYKGQKLGILGLYHKEPARMMARFIDVINNLKNFRGIVIGVDEKNFNITVGLPEKKHITTDIETSTKSLSYTKDGGLVKSGFSKITTGERILVVGFTDLKDKNRVIAKRVIIFPELVKNPLIDSTVIPTAEPTPTNTPTPTKKPTR